MAMLAEPRKKTKYRVQPFSGFSKINKRCDGDTGSAAFKMMAKMGWAPGKGLGVNESGNVDPIKLRLKNDDAGLGYKVSEDDALAQQSEFQALLLQLNSGSNDNEIEAEDVKKKLKKPKIKSLEKQSEQSTKRVHYKKFTRGKDLSRASEQDLMSILGISTRKPKVKEPEPEVTAPEPTEDADTIHGTNMYITAGSSVDYFKKRSLEKKCKKQKLSVGEATLSDSIAEESKNENKNKRRSVTWGDVDVSYVDKYIKDMVDTSGSVDESLNNSECIEEPATKKKKKKKNKGVPAEITDSVMEEPVQDNAEKKKMKVAPVEVSESLMEESVSVSTEKKKKRLTSAEVLESVIEEPVPVNNEKKKKKKRISPAEEPDSVVEDPVPVNTEKKKKKKRKICEDENSKENIDEGQENPIEPKKKKKRKINALDEEIVSEANNCVDNSESDALIASEEQNSNVEATEELKQKKKKKKKRNQVDALPEQSQQVL